MLPKFHELIRYTNLAPGKVAWGRLGKSISLNSGFACVIALLNFERKLAKKSVNRKEKYASKNKTLEIKKECKFS